MIQKYIVVKSRRQNGMEAKNIYLENTYNIIRREQNKIPKRKIFKILK